jgi:hypothetical protein
VFAEDFRRATQAELYGLDHGRGGRRISTEERIPLYDAPMRYHGLRAVRCAHPRCFDEAAARCATCRRVYCLLHCPGGTAGIATGRHECDRCRQKLPLEAERRGHYVGAVPATGAIVVFLLIVSAGIAIDVGTRGNGLFVLWVFAGAFFALVWYLDG